MESAKAVEFEEVSETAILGVFGDGDAMINVPSQAVVFSETPSNGGEIKSYFGDHRALFIVGRSLLVLLVQHFLLETKIPMVWNLTYTISLSILTKNPRTLILVAILDG